MLRPVTELLFSLDNLHLIICFHFGFSYLFFPMRFLIGVLRFPLLFLFSGFQLLFAIPSSQLF